MTDNSRLDSTSNRDSSSDGLCPAHDALRLLARLLGRQAVHETWRASEFEADDKVMSDPDARQKEES